MLGRLWHVILAMSFAFALLPSAFSQDAPPEGEPPVVENPEPEDQPPPPPDMPQPDAEPPPPPPAAPEGGVPLPPRTTPDAANPRPGLNRERPVQPQPKPAQPASTNPHVEFEVGLGEDVWGTIVVELYPDKAPKTVENFLQYVNSGFYNNTIIHRLVRANDGISIAQGGGFVAIGEKKTEGLLAPVMNESQNGLKNERGTLGLARGRDANSGRAQFYFNLQDNPAIDYPNPDGHGFCVFGKVVSGMNVMDRLRTVSTRSSTIVRSERSQPRQPPVIRHVKTVPPPPAEAMRANAPATPPSRARSNAPNAGAAPGAPIPAPTSVKGAQPPNPGMDQKSLEERRAEARRRIMEQRNNNKGAALKPDPPADPEGEKAESDAAGEEEPSEEKPD